jgi:integrase
VAKLHAKLVNVPYEANRALALVSAIWNWAARRDEVIASANPCTGIERYPERERERFLTSDELGRLGAALVEGETVGLPYLVNSEKPGSKHAPKESNRRTLTDPHAVAAIRLLILTGARLREVLHARWEHVDIERGVIFLVDSKTGRKPVYLSAAALEVLAGLPRIEGNPYIVPGEKAGRPKSDLKRRWTAICKSAGLKGVRLHDLRHSFASIGAGANMGLPVIGKLLGHSQAATTHRYAHLDADPLRRAVNAIGATISAAMEGKTQSEIVQIRHRK